VFTVRFLSKKSNQIDFFFKKKPKPVQTDRFRFGSVRFFREKTGSNRFGSVFSVWLGFFGLARFFSGSVFPVPDLKKRTGRFFQNFNRFFLRFGFFGYFFSCFLGLIGFSVFFNTPKIKEYLFLPLFFFTIITWDQECYSFLINKKK